MPLRDGQLQAPARHTRLGRRLIVLVLLFCFSLGVASEPAQTSSTWDTLKGFNNVRSVFRQNGFPDYKATYVRCYTDAEWKKVRRGHSGLMGWYDGGVWIHVRSATCVNSAKALQGQVSYTNAVALATVMHEAIHRQGIRSESMTECLSTWLSAHAVLAWTGSEAKALRTLGLVRLYAQTRLPSGYQTTARECAAIATGFGVLPIAAEEPPPDTTPAPPVPPPPPPAEHLVGYKVGDYVSVSSFNVPAAHTTVVIWFSTVGPYDVTVTLGGQHGVQQGTYRVQGVSELRFSLPSGWPSLNTGPSVSVFASPDFAWSWQNPGQAKIELRVLTTR